MWVYIYQSWTEKALKNAYIGEYVPPYLCFTANEANSTVKLQKTWSPIAVTLETSTDGNNWSTYTIGNTITLSNVWDKVYWRNASETTTWFSTSVANRYQFSMSWSISASGDANFLLNKASTDTVGAYNFNYLFYGCSSLTTAPQLPATTINTSCYQSMFYECSSLTTAPSELPATTIADACYSGMFYWCSSLTDIPNELPATSLPLNCYDSMFANCTSLTTTPKISATTITWTDCCNSMFEKCSNLITLPKLASTWLSDRCYVIMFSGCSKIKLSTTQTWEYQTPYRIPTTWTWTTGQYSIYNMFTNTWWTFTWTPSINTTYYTSNTVV